MIVLGGRYITLPAIEGNASRGLIGNSTFLSAGASKPTVANSSDANECSFGETYRTGKRGGQYIGLTADIPYSALFVSFSSSLIVSVTKIPSCIAALRCCTCAYTACLCWTCCQQSYCVEPDQTLLTNVMAANARFIIDLQICGQSPTM